MRNLADNGTIAQTTCHAGNYDVVVVGGGTTGIAAAIAAARSGARTAIVESYGFLGGNAATGLVWLGFHDLKETLVVGGIALEMITLLRQERAASRFYNDPIVGSIVSINPHWWKLIAMDQITVAGVTPILHSLLIAAEACPDGDGKRLYIQGKGGVRTIDTRVLIDCTDSGDAARHAGARMFRGRPKDHKVQVSSWTFQVGGVDVDALVDYFITHPDELRPFGLPEPVLAGLLEQMKTAEVFVIGAFRSLVAKAKREGMALSRDNVPGHVDRALGMASLVATRIENVDSNDAANFSRAEQQGMRQTRLWLEFLTRYAPGFEDCYLCGTPHQVGIREANHLEGDYQLTAEDLLAGRDFPDVIAMGAYHLDIHSPDHGGIETQRPPIYQIPYRCLIPRDLENVLVAGRAISATHEAMSSTRVIPIGMAMGQAAGTAAALAVRQECTVRDVPMAQLQDQLVADGAILPARKMLVEYDRQHA